MSWLGGGIIIVIAGFWGVFKFVNQPPSAPTVGSDNGSIALSGDVQNSVIVVNNTGLSEDALKKIIAALNARYEKNRRVSKIILNEQYSQKDIGKVASGTKKKLLKYPALNLIGEGFVTTKAVQLYVGPGYEYSIKATIEAGANLHIVGRVREKPWYAVVTREKDSGFVKIPAILPKMVGSVRASQACRTIEQQVRFSDGTFETERIRECKDGGVWKVQ